MSIESIFNKISHTDIDNAFIKNIRNSIPFFSRADKKFLNDIIANPENFEIDDIIKGIKLFLIFSVIDDGYELRKKGLFSYGRNSDFRQHIPQIIKSLIDFNEIYNLDEKFLKFLQKKHELGFLIELYDGMEKSIKDEIIAHHNRRTIKHTDRGQIESSLFKELLTLIDYLFLLSPQTDDVYYHKDNISDYSKECLCFAVSNLINLYNKYIGIKQNVHYYADIVYASSKQPSDLILTACKLDNLRELENFIDYYDYEVQIDGNNVLINGDKHNVEKSIRLGYLKQKLAQSTSIFRQINNSLNDNVLDFSTFMEEVIKTFPNILRKIKDNNLPRYRLEMPANLFYNLDKIMPGTDVFHDEFIRLNIERHDLVIPDILNKKITEHCTVHDVIKFQRFFCLTNEIYKKCLLKKNDIKKILASLTPAVSKDRFQRLFSNILGDETKAFELIELFSYIPGTNLDLQYSPFIKSSGGVSYSNSVVSESNLIRNSIIQSTRRGLQTVNIPEQCDALTIWCNNALKKAGFKTISEKEFAYNGANSDVDVMAISDSAIFIFECKCPINPTSNTELRNTFDYVRKASGQLDLISLALNDQNWAKKFLENNGLKYISDRKTYTCILLGNRMFGGYNKYAHPIRNIFELNNILTSGEIQVGEHAIKIWKQYAFSEEDLIAFLSETENCHIKQMMDRLMPIEQTMTVDKYKFVYNTYCLDATGLAVSASEIK